MSPITVYVFFATWCVPCRQEMPHVADLAREYRDRGVRFVLVSEDAPSTAPQLPAFLARFGVEGELVLDEDSSLLEKYNPAANIPFTAIVNSRGQVLYSRAGYEPGDENRLREFLNEQLAARPPPAADSVLPRPPNEAAKTLPARSALRLAEPAMPPAPGAVASIYSTTMGVRRNTSFRDTESSPSEANVLTERIEGAVTAGRFALAARVDAAVLERTLAADRDARLEKLRAAMSWWRLRLSAGDEYAKFGNGLVLSVRRIDLLGQDTTVRGGRLEYVGDRLDATALAGVFNPQNVDTIDFKQVDDAGDLVAAAQLRERAGGLLLGQTLVGSRITGGSVTGADVDLMMVGLSAEGKSAQTWGMVDAALEIVGLTRRGFAAAGARENGHGAYGRISVAGHTTVMLLEGKLYRRMSFPGSRANLLYHEPPTLERDDQELSGNADSAGFRLRLDHRVHPRATIFWNGVAYRTTLDGTDPLQGGVGGAALDRGLLWHTYVGADTWHPSGFSGALSAGARRENDASGARRRSNFQLNADAAQKLGSFALVAKWDHRFDTKELVLGPKSFVRGTAVLGLTWRSFVTLSGLYGYSTEAARNPTHYPGAEVRVIFAPHVDLRLFAGRLVGGRVCVSGACRDVLPFEGARLDLQMRY
ncbi:MAG: redoxin family protein [Deltaproteobacteria bacterium]|nr:redoxin family protein [Deltaproteobacteria bacterium]